MASAGDRGECSESVGVEPALACLASAPGTPGSAHNAMSSGLQNAVTRIGRMQGRPPLCGGQRSPSSRQMTGSTNASHRKGDLMAGFRKAIGVALAALVFAAAPTAAQEYPSKPISLLVPFAAGGPTDIVARTLGQAMGKVLKQPIIVENAVGAGGTIAPTKLKNAAPDGYTLLLAHIGMATAPALYRTLQFKPVEDFEHIGQVVDVPMTLLGKLTIPPKDLKELLPYIKANKDKISFANAGVGSASHLCGLLFMSAIEVDMTTVPYKGTAPAMNDLLGGQVDLLCDQTTQTTQYIGQAV
jgi:tripartite-type tricarboxylate transporter receptor subunit TctC